MRIDVGVDETSSLLRKLPGKGNVGSPSPLFGSWRECGSKIALFLSVHGGVDWPRAVDREIDVKHLHFPLKF